MGCPTSSLTKISKAFITQFGMDRCNTKNHSKGSSLASKLLIRKLHLLGVVILYHSSPRPPGTEFQETLKSTSFRTTRSATNKTGSENVSRWRGLVRTELDNKVFNTQSGESDSVDWVYLKMDWLAPEWDNKCFAESSKENNGFQIMRLL
jgi:hypothetical protein